MGGAALIWSSPLGFHMWRWKPKDAQGWGRCQISSPSPGLSPLYQQFSNLSTRRNHPEKPVKPQVLGPTPRVLILKFTFLVNSQGMLLRLVWGPHLENPCSTPSCWVEK